MASAALSAQELLAVAQDDPHSAPVALTLLTGLRLGEVLALRSDDIGALFAPPAAEAATG